MKFELQFKTPDIFDQLIYQAIVKKEVEELLNKFIKHAENITIEFDTETKNAKVLSIA